jgi:hypothetical protein
MKNQQPKPICYSHRKLFWLEIKTLYKKYLLLCIALLLTSCSIVTPTSTSQPLFLGDRALEGQNQGGIEIEAFTLLRNWEYEDYSGPHIRLIVHEGGHVQLDPEYQGRVRVLGWVYSFGGDESTALARFTSYTNQFGHDFIYVTNDVEDMRQFGYTWMA